MSNSRYKLNIPYPLKLKKNHEESSKTPSTVSKNSACMCVRVCVNMYMYLRDKNSSSKHDLANFFLERFPFSLFAVNQS